MMRYLKLLFPLPDHLYIFQLLEYNSREFLFWFIRYPFKRNLQRKNRLILTQKSISLLILSNLLMVFLAVWFNILFFRGLDLPVLVLFILYFQLLSPFFLMLSQLLLFPLENYSKQQKIAAARLKLSGMPKLKIIAITGSFAKTSTKDMLYTLLWKKYRVVKTPKSYNNPLSIAQTILELVKKNTQVLIVEVGAYRKGEIRKVVSWLKPGIGIITGIAPQHLERFGSLENIARAKFELAEGLPKNGTAILNWQNETIKKMAKKVRCRIIFFGKPNLQIDLPLAGEHHLQNFSAAALAALELGLSPAEIKERSKQFLPTPHRLEIKHQNGLTIIDNSYNTNFESSKISFKLLKDISGKPASAKASAGKQKIIITPGLIELGSQSQKINREFIINAAKVADEIIIVGECNQKDLLAGLVDAKFPKDKTHIAQDLQHGIQLLGKITKRGGGVALIENDLPDQYF
ncbi:UDP-N-acetylmuramoyl-tripeptide--D-alanyl-D-alanine ligase [Candidatus Daviesbacteria bacterium]|nr:UDP-N-acetylmuramoyl-tripeptide--D-alanyl-D-alanine ligase [Candidatus Daviesbacteria bacterium]